MTTADLEAEKSKRKYVIYENYLLDVEDYVKSHPGGRNLILDNLYTDVGRYMTGTQAYSTEIKAHSHNFSTFEYALKKLAYAEIKDKDNVAIKEYNDHFVNETFSVKGKREVAQNVYEYRFSSVEISFSRFLPGHTWIGKHFSVTSKKLNKTRYYTICLSMDDDIKECHNSLLDSIMNESQPKRIDNDSSLYLSIYSKRYNYPGAVSNELFFSMDDFIIRGPMGVGLGLDRKLSGTHIIFAAGTGILPFVDLIALTIRYIANKTKGKKIFNEKFDNISDDFKLAVFTSYSNQDSSIYHLECEKLADIDKSLGLNIFEYNYRFSNKDNSRWDSQFMQNNLKHFKNIKKIQIVGPVNFMECVQEALPQNLREFVSLP